MSFILRNNSSSPVFLIETRQTLQPQDLSLPISRLLDGTQRLIDSGVLVVDSGSLPTVAPVVAGGLLTPRGAWDGGTQYRGAASTAEASDLVFDATDGKYYLPRIVNPTVGDAPHSHSDQWVLFVDPTIAIALAGGGGGSFSESALRDVLQALGGTLYFNYQRLNAVGHPHPAWPHGVVTVAALQAMAQQAKFITIGGGGGSVALSALTPWQGAVALDKGADTAIVLPTNPTIGDIVDIACPLSSNQATVTTGGGNTITGSATVGQNSVNRYTYVGASWTQSSLSWDQWFSAINAAAVNDGLGHVLGKINLNGQRINGLGDPTPEYPRGAVTLGHADNHYLPAAGKVWHILDAMGQSSAETGPLPQFVESRNRSGSPGAFDLPVGGGAGIKVFVRVSMGTQSLAVIAAMAGSIDAGSNTKTLGPNTTTLFTSTGTDTWVSSSIDPTDYDLARIYSAVLMGCYGYAKNAALFQGSNTDFITSSGAQPISVMSAATYADLNTAAGDVTSTLPDGFVDGMEKVIGIASTHMGASYIVTVTHALGFVGTITFGDGVATTWAAVRLRWVDNGGFTGWTVASAPTGGAVVA